MTTEAEAKTKWCPFVSLSSPTGDTLSRTNRGAEIIPMQTKIGQVFSCIGSSCNAWRPTNDRAGSHSEAKDYVPTGYCGLAGKP